MARSTLTRVAGVNLSMADFSIVSPLTSKVASWPSIFVTVRHVPFMAMLSPIFVPWARLARSTVICIPLELWRNVLTGQTASISPVNIKKAFLTSVLLVKYSNYATFILSKSQIIDCL